jgi:hypothetical protein
MKKFYRNLLRLKTGSHDMKGLREMPQDRMESEPLAYLIAVQIHFEGKITNHSTNPLEQMT